MDHDKAMKELDRILDALTKIDDPGSKEYKDILQSYERLYKVVWDECKNCDDQVEKQHRQEIEKKRLEIEERKLAIEEKKMEISKENDLARNELENKKLDLEREKARLESRRLDNQEFETVNKIRIEEKKADAAIEEDHNRARYTKKQALGRLAEIGVEGLIMTVGIIVTGKVSDGVILDKNMWSLIRKVK